MYFATMLRTFPTTTYLMSDNQMAQIVSMVTLVDLKTNYLLNETDVMYTATTVM